MKRPAAILFDMDGTLTEERLQWDDLRSQLGVEENKPILESILKMNDADRAQAEAILHQHEHQAACRACLNFGCDELLTWLDENQIGRALITRNTRASVRTVFDRCGLHFEIALSREDGHFKPSPTPLLLACERLGVEIDDVWMVGDWKYDIEAANAAGVFGVWLSYGRERTFEAVPDLVVNDLCELLATLKTL